MKECILNHNNASGMGGAVGIDQAAQGCPAVSGSAALQGVPQGRPKVTAPHFCADRNEKLLGVGSAVLKRSQAATGQRRWAVTKSEKCLGPTPRRGCSVVCL